MLCLAIAFFVVNSLVFPHAIKVENASLVFAQVIFRHGDRNPLITYSNDPWKDDWPEGFGQLTKLGMQQEHELGQYFRKRYESLLPVDVYPNKIVYVQSTDRERTLMSAASVLAGLFPPTKNQLWNDNIAWQPIPIHTMPVNMDYILAARKHCDRYEFLVKEHFNRPEYKEWRLKYKRLYEYIEEKSGLSTDEPLNVIFLHDALRIHQMKNKTIPEWASNIYGELTKLAIFEEFSFIGTREMSRLTSGYLLGEIIERFNKKVNGTLQPNRTLWLMSGHDTTLTSLLNFLAFAQSELPPYAASILLELYQHEGQHFVQIVYKKNNNENIPTLDIPSCGTLCPLDKFYEIYKAFIPTNDFETECKLE